MGSMTKEFFLNEMCIKHIRTMHRCCDSSGIMRRVRRIHKEEEERNEKIKRKRDREENIFPLVPFHCHHTYIEIL